MFRASVLLFYFFVRVFIFSLESRVPCTSVYNFLSTCYFVLSLAHISFDICVLFNFQGSKVGALCSAVLDTPRLRPQRFALSKSRFEHPERFAPLYLMLSGSDRSASRCPSLASNTRKFLPCHPSRGQPVHYTTCLHSCQGVF